MRRGVKDELKRLEQEGWHNPSARLRELALAMLDDKTRDQVRDAFNRVGAPDDVDLNSILAFHLRRAETAKRARQYDPMEIVRADYFTGKIYFDSAIGAYLPEYREEQFTRIRRGRERDMLDIRLNRAWDEMREQVKHETPREGVPVLLRDMSDKHVYFIRCKNTELIKIGIARRPADRLKQISQDLSASFRFNADKAPSLQLMHIVDSGGRDLEKMLHDAFSEFRLSYHGTQTEWFEPKTLLRLYIHGLQMGADAYDTIPKALQTYSEKPSPR